MNRPRGKEESFAEYKQKLKHGEKARRLYLRGKRTSGTKTKEQAEK